jgi:predicted ATPase/DNA-binding SARP family transcriptional activator
MIPPLRMSLLGDFLLVLGETPVTTVTLPRVQSLLTYLVLHRSAPQDRSHLAFLLWPDSTEAQAHTNLRQLLYHLRQSLPYATQFVHADRQSLQWQPTQDVTFTLDVEEFERALATASQAEQARDLPAVRQALELTVHLYRGDLFPGCYDDWIFPERDRLHQSFLNAANRLMTLLEEERDYPAAVTVAQLLLRHDALHEATYRQLMRLHALCGDRASALRVYHTCASRLERELGIMPSEATQQMYEQLVQHDSTPQPVISSPVTPGSASLIGRRIQWRQLQAAWQKAVEGHPHLVLISGEAGIGKTRLCEEMEAWVSRQGMTTASARCYAAEGRLPYAPVTAWLRSEAIQASALTLDPVFLTEIARLLPELQTQRSDVPRPRELREAWQRQHFFEALARALLAARQPLLLLLDDLHWCDAETLEWLHYLFRSAPYARLLLLGTVRAEEVLPEHALVASLRTWQPDDLVTELTLEPLSSSETTSLAEQVAGHPLDDATIRTLQRETEGNPFFVIEMVRAGTLARQRQEQPESASADQPRPLLTQSTPRLPPTVQTVLAARLGQLSQEARDLAGLAAIIGREFSFTVLSRASGKPEEELVRGLDELWQRRIVREQGIDAYDFSHEQLRQQALTSLSALHRRLLHRRVAEALTSSIADQQDAASSQIAAHYEQAGLPERAIPYYLRAGEVAGRVYAHDEALLALQRAATLLASPSHSPQEPSWQTVTAVYERLGDILEMIGRHEEAEQSYLQARKPVPDQETLLHARLCRKLAVTRDYPPHLAEASRAYREAAQLLQQVQNETREWRDEWIHTHLGHLQVLFLQGEWQEMTRIIEQIQPLLEQYGTADQRANFFMQVAMRDAVRDHYVVAPATLSTCQAGLQASLETGNPHLIGTARFTLGYCLLLSGQFEQAEEHLRAALLAGELVGDAELVARCRLHFLPLVFRRRGQVEAVRSAIADAEKRGERRYAGVIAAQCSWIAWRDDRREAAEKAGRAALEAWQRQRPVYPFQWTGLWPLIDLATSLEQFARAVDYARRLLAPTQQRPTGALAATLEEMLQAWEAGQQERVSSLLQRALRLAQDTGYL